MAVMAVLLTSCEKEVHINLASSSPQVVVQGAIETGSAPYVLLNSTIGFFSKVDLATYQNSFIHDAEVSVSDGLRSVQLKEYSFDTGGSFKFYVYTLNLSDPADTMIGQNGKTYTLTIKYNGQTYTGSTKIPYPQGIDTMWFDVPQFAGEKTPDSAKQLYVTYTDPDTPGDYVKYFTQRDNGPFYPSGNFSDEIVNGKVISNIGLEAGYGDDGIDHLKDSLIYFFPGEEVTLKWCAIDKGVYTFWNTLDFAKSSIGNPFASPINPTTNMKNGALGIWAGYGVYLKKARVPY